MSLVTNRSTLDSQEDPWLPFEPTDQRPFSPSLAAHLLRRAAFGGTASEHEQIAKLGPQAAVDRLFTVDNAAAFDAEADLMVRTSLVLGDSTKVLDWWLYRMLNDPHGVREKATFFWHGHFCTSREKVVDAPLLLEQNKTLRAHSLGSFRELVKAISRDAAMLIYLDSTENRKHQPNENYARELLELFCLGLDNYSEQDIKELARCFTGWEVRRRRFRISRSDHDTGIKTVLGTTGPLDGDQAVDVILEQPAAARFIAEKLIRFYVTDYNVPPSAIDGLAKQIIDFQWQIEPVLRTIFRSRIFYSAASVGGKIAGPVDWTLSWWRTLEVQSSLQQLRQALESMGQVPLEPPNVKGWPGGKTWIDPARIAARVNWTQRLADDQLNAGGRLSGWLSQQGLNSADSIIHWISVHLLPAQVASVRDTIMRDRISLHNQPVDQFREAIRVVGVLPEAHLI